MLYTGKTKGAVPMIKAMISVVLSFLGGMAGFFFGSGLNQPVEMMLFGTMVIGVGCIVYAIDNKK